MDDLNVMWNSKDPAMFSEFYSRFNNNMELIKWMRSRPRAPIKIYESDGSEEICVLIPTASHNNVYSKTAKKIYKGFKIVFVESHGAYFNLAKSVNYGLSYILKKYKPDWIVLSNDDVYKIDKLEVLKKELAALDENKVDAAFRAVGKQHGELYGYFVRPNPLLSKIYALIQPDPERRRYLSLLEKFKINYLASNRLSGYGFLFDLVFRDKIKVYGESRFAAFSRKFVEGMRGKIFDETYINGFEDCDLCLRITHKYNYRFINFRLGCYNGKSLGVGTIRMLRDIANLTYFNYRIATDKDINGRQ